MTSWFRCAPCGVRSAPHDLLTTGRAFARHIVFGVALLSVVFALGLAAPRAQAQIYVDADASGAGDGSSWANAYPDLQDALNVATGTDQIWIAAGTYTPTVPLDGNWVPSTTFLITGDQDGLKIYGGFNGTETTLNQRDLGAGHETILSGDIGQDDAPFAPRVDSDGNPDTPTQTDHVNGGNSYHVLVFDGGYSIGPDVGANVTPATVLDGVTVTGGQADGAVDGPTFNRRGGGLYCDGSGSGNACSPQITNAVFTGNSAGSRGAGGAIYNGATNGGTSSPQITNVTFTGNVADYGGAIYNKGNFEGTSSPQITNATFAGNTAYFNDGGAIYNDGFGGASRPQITNSILWGSGDEVFNNNATPQYSHTLVRGLDLTGTGTGNLDGSTSNLVFVDAGDPNGPDDVFGTTDDGLRLALGSAALDAGDDAAVPLAEDITGAPRIQDGTVDLGAYEGGVDTAVTFYVDAGATGAGNGLSWADAFSHLQDALSAATGNDQIWIAAGTYYPDEGTGVTGDDRSSSFTIAGIQDGLQVYGGFAGTETALSQRNLAAGHETILSGDIGRDDAPFAPQADSDGNPDTPSQTDHINGGNSYHVLVFDGRTEGAVTTATVLDGVTVTGGQANGSSSEGRGGGLYCDGQDSGSECSPQVTNAIFAGNTAIFGGAVQSNGGSYGTSRPQFTNVVFTGNVAGEYGGAMHNDGNFYGTSSPVVTSTTFTGNAARQGGAIYNVDTSTGTSRPRITNTILWGNASDFGDGVSGSDAPPEYSHTLAEGVDLTGTGTGNLDGTASANDPLFVNIGDPNGTDDRFGTTDDGLRLSLQSPAIDAGDDGAISLAGDLTDAPRIQDGAVDLGPYEGGVDLAVIFYVDARATGVGNGSSWSDAFPNVQDALAASAGNNQIWNDQIWVAAGTYYPDEGAGVTGDDRNASFTVTGGQDGLAIYGGFAGIEATFADRDLGAGHETILSGDIGQDDAPFAPRADSDGNPDTPTQTDHVNGGNSYHVLVFDGGSGVGSDVSANLTPATILNGVTVTGGVADGGAANNFGGGLYCDGSGSGNACSPQITNAIFTGNAAVSTTESSGGGAIYNDGSNAGTSRLQVTNALFIGNAGGFAGGAIYNNGDAGTSSAVITNATFTANLAGARGGAIYSRGGFSGTSRPQITNTIVWANTTGFGSGIDNEGATPEYRHTLAEGLDLTGTGTGNLDGTDPANDPLFMDAGDFRGPDNTFGTVDDGLHLSLASPALGAGTNAPFEAGGIAEAISTDLAGDARIQDGTVDLGAYEGPAGTVTATETVAGDGLVGFPGTNVDVAFTGVSGSGTVTVQVAPAPPADLGGLDPAFVTGYRLAITVTGDLTFGPSTEIRVDLSGFSDGPSGDVPDPNEAVIYRRATIGSGTFSALPTTYDAGANQLVATTGTFSEFVVYNDPSAIPVELATFTGSVSRTSGRDEVTLRWATASEQSNSGFEVQRRSAGQWERLAFVKGAGTTSDPQTYRFRDSALPFADSLVYRLRQVDVDGRAEFSPTVVVGRGSGTAVQLVAPFPNPTRQRATVRYVVPDGGAQPVRLDVYNLLGQRVATLVQETKASGREEIVLDASGWASGTYFLRLQVGGAMRTERLTVVR